MKTIRGQLDADEEQTLYGLSETFNKYMPSKLYILASNDLRGDSILTIKQQIVDTIQSKGIKTIYVDYLQLMKFGFSGKGNIYEYLNEVVGMFRWIAVAYDVRIVLLSQATKEGIKRGKRTNGEFEATDASEANALLRDSYYLLTLYLDDGLKTQSQIKNQFLYHRDGESYTEPKVTSIIPSKYIMGTLDILPFESADDIAGQPVEENDESKVSPDLDLDAMFAKNS